MKGKEKYITSGDWSEKATNFSRGVKLGREVHRGLGVYSGGEYSPDWSTALAIMSRKGAKAESWALVKGIEVEYIRKGSTRG